LSKKQFQGKNTTPTPPIWSCTALHPAGYDHENEVDAGRMGPETAIMRSIKIDDPYA
jgi:hypothetical protein